MPIIRGAPDDIHAELYNALCRRARARADANGQRAYFSTTHRAAEIAVMALDAAIDKWCAGQALRGQGDDVAGTVMP